MEKELKYLKGAVDSPVRPMACIVGGAKISSKVCTCFEIPVPRPCIPLVCVMCDV